MDEMCWSSSQSDQSGMTVLSFDLKSSVGGHSVESISSPFQGIRSGYVTCGSLCLSVKEQVRNYLRMVQVVQFQNVRPYEAMMEIVCLLIMMGDCYDLFEVDVETGVVDAERSELALWQGIVVLMNVLHIYCMRYPEHNVTPRDRKWWSRVSERPKFMVSPALLLRHDVALSVQPSGLLVTEEYMLRKVFIQSVQFLVDRFSPPAEWKDSVIHVHSNGYRTVSLWVDPRRTDSRQSFSGLQVRLHRESEEQQVVSLFDSYLEFMSVSAETGALYSPVGTEE